MTTASPCRCHTGRIDAAVALNEAGKQRVVVDRRLLRHVRPATGDDLFQARLHLQHGGKHGAPGERLRAAAARVGGRRAPGRGRRVVAGGGARAVDGPAYLAAEQVRQGGVVLVGEPALQPAQPLPDDVRLLVGRRAGEQSAELRRVAVLQATRQRVFRRLVYG